MWTSAGAFDKTDDVGGAEILGTNIAVRPLAHQEAADDRLVRLDAQRGESALAAEIAAIPVQQLLERIANRALARTRRDRDAAQMIEQRCDGSARKPTRVTRISSLREELCRNRVRE